MNKNKRYGLRTWIEIDTKAIKHNVEVFRSLIKPECLIMSVVKSNAYGHGLVEFTRIAEKLGIDYFGVDSAIEGMALRHSGIKKPILVLGYTLPEMVKEAVQNNLSLSVSNLDALNSLVALKLKRPIKIHLKVDTGMHRQGIVLTELEETIRILLKNKNIKIDGLATHLADPSNRDQTDQQLTKWDQAVEIFHKYFQKGDLHFSASGGIDYLNQASCNCLRLGLGLYGFNVSENRQLALKPVLSFFAKIVNIKNIGRGEKVGYNFTYEAPRETKIAILPCGYYEGVPLELSNQGIVYFKDHPLKIIGRVSMNLTAIDITDLDSSVSLEDEIEVISSNPERLNSVENIAKICETIPYEILIHLDKSLKRYVK